MRRGQSFEEVQRRYRKDGSKLVEVDAARYLQQLNYAELEMRVAWFAYTEFQKTYPELINIVPPDSIEFVGEDAYEKFQEFCKTLGDGS